MSIITGTLIDLLGGNIPSETHPCFSLGSLKVSLTSKISPARRLKLASGKLMSPRKTGLLQGSMSRSRDCLAGRTRASSSSTGGGEVERSRKMERNFSFSFNLSFTFFVTGSKYAHKTKCWWQNLKEKFFLYYYPWNLIWVQFYYFDTKIE